MSDDSRYVDGEGSSRRRPYAKKATPPVSVPIELSRAVWRPNALERTLEILRRHKQLGFPADRIVVISMHGIAARTPASNVVSTPESELDAIRVFIRQENFSQITVGILGMQQLRRNIDGIPQTSYYMFSGPWLSARPASFRLGLATVPVAVFLFVHAAIRDREQFFRIYSIDAIERGPDSERKRAGRGPVELRRRLL